MTPTPNFIDPSSQLPTFSNRHPRRQRQQQQQHRNNNGTSSNIATTTAGTINTTNSKRKRRQEKKLQRKRRKLERKHHIKYHDKIAAAADDDSNNTSSRNSNKNASKSSSKKKSHSAAESKKPKTFHINMDDPNDLSSIESDLDDEWRQRQNDASDQDSDQDQFNPDALSDSETMIRVPQHLIKSIKSGKANKLNENPDDPDDMMIRRMEKLLGLNRNRKKKELYEKEMEASKEMTLKEYVQQKREAKMKQQVQERQDHRTNETLAKFNGEDLINGEEDMSDDDRMETNDEGTDALQADMDAEEEHDPELVMYDDLDAFLTGNLDADEEEEERMLNRFTSSHEEEDDQQPTSKHNAPTSLDQADEDEDEQMLAENDEFAVYDDLDNFLTSNLDADEEEEERMLSRFTAPEEEDSDNEEGESRKPHQRDDSSIESSDSEDPSLQKKRVTFSGPPSENKSSITTTTATAATKYVPPHLRKKQLMEESKKSADYIALEQQMRGICNRLSHTNIVQLTLDTLKIYQSSSKNYFNEILANIIIRSLMDDVVMLGQFIVVYAGYVIALHNISGGEVGAHFLESLVQKYEECRKSANNKAVMNMTMFFAHLYNMSLFSSDFIFDMVEQVIESSEKTAEDNGDIEQLSTQVEVTYKLLLTCGVLLRRNNQSKFRRLIHNVQTRFTQILDKQQSENGSMKAKTFIDLIGDVYSRSKREDQQEEYAKYQLLRKAIYKLQQKMDVHGDLTLNVSYSDLRDSHVKGRWWLVGTAWSGHNAQGSTIKAERDKSSTLTSAPATKDDKKRMLLKRLAVKQKMTTALRVDVFCAIMGADGVEEAVKELMPLNIIQNDREICRVIVHCCCQEKRFNEYYANLVERLCSFKRFSRALQFVFYERFRDLSAYDMRHVINLCFLLSALFANGSLKLSILKVVEFMELSGKSLIFFRLLFVNLFLDNSVEQNGHIFFKMAKNSHLTDLKHSLKLFLMELRNKESRRSILPELLAIRNGKKQNKELMKVEESIIKKCTKKMLKVLSYQPQIIEDRN